MRQWRRGSEEMWVRVWVCARYLWGDWMEGVCGGVLVISALFCTPGSFRMKPQWRSDANDAALCPDIRWQERQTRISVFKYSDNQTKFHYWKAVKRPLKSCLNYWTISLSGPWTIGFVQSGSNHYNSCIHPPIWYFFVLSWAKLWYPTPPPNPPVQQV